MTETPQLSVPEQQEGMIAPGQEKLVEQIQEGESSIPEKFQNASREDVSESYEALAEVFNVSKDVIDNYIQSAQASKGDTPVLNQQDGVDVRNAIGGDQAFQDVTEWAGKNLDKGMLDEYNKIADSNKDAAIWALRAMQGMMGNPNAVVEPKLYGGGTEPTVQRFNSKQEVLDAMNKKNDKGQRLYDVDSAYQEKIARTMANSDVF